MAFAPLPWLLAAVGLYLLIRLRFFYFLHPRRSFGSAFSALSSRENLRAFTIALAGTLGVGNVLGVASGLIIGGPGALFWIFISAIPASALKYAEVLVASDVGRGGMAAAARGSFPRFGRALSVVYSLSCLALAFVMGAARQSRSVADSAEVALGIDGGIAAIVLCLIVFVSVLRGSETIGKITAIVIPLTTIVYIIIALSAIFTFIDRLPTVISLVINNAFDPAAGLGGVVSALNSKALREGFARGMLSNEAGAGTSSLGHTSSGVLKSSVRALFGALEVFFDTSLLCTLSGLAILVSLPDLSAAEGGMQLILSSLGSALGSAAPIFVALSVLAFAYSTVVCWYYYGTECMTALSGRPSRLVFPVLFLSFVLLGGAISEGVLISLSDTLLFVLTLITLPTLIKNSDRIVTLSESNIKSKSKESDP